MLEADQKRQIVSRTLHNLGLNRVGEDTNTVCSDEANTIAEIDKEVADKDKMVGNIAGGQDAFTEPQPILNWGGKKNRPGPEICEEHSHYKTTRTISGLCNNLEHPLRGAASTAQPRMIKQTYYADGISEPRGGWKSSRAHCCTGKNTFNNQRKHCLSTPDALLPNPRLVRQHFHTGESQLDPNTTLMFTVFGQFLDHDMSLTPEAPIKGCCEDLKETECFAMKEIFLDTCQDPMVCDAADKAENKTRIFQNSDVRSKKQCGVKDCYKLARSLQFIETGTSKRKPRQQVNAITSFIDASNVYGSDINLHRRLRVENSALLRDSGDESPVVPEINGTHGTAGDKRSSEVPELLSIHTVFLREHNRIVMDIESKLRANSDTRAEDVYFVFEKAREILIAEMQNIVYDQYVEALLGDDKEDLFDNDRNTKYNDNIKPGITNEFSTVAYRFGHSMVAGINKKYNLLANSAEVGRYNIKDNYFDTKEFSANDNLGFEQILNGLTKDASEGCDPFMDVDLSKHLFENNNPFGDDLGARNIQRGRDHGLAGYTEYRALCEIDMPICNWDEEERPKEISADKWQKLSELYDHPADIDLFTGGLAEDPHYNGGTVGRTFNCILRKQFLKLKLGDRFFFSHKETKKDRNHGLKRLNDEQKDEIKARHLSHILCDNTDIAEMRSNAFRLDSPYEACPAESTLEIKKFLMPYET